MQITGNGDVDAVLWNNVCKGHLLRDDPTNKTESEIRFPAPCNTVLNMWSWGTDEQGVWTAGVRDANGTVIKLKQR
jgi:hypothetical protein